MKTALESYRQSREALLEQISTDLSGDERFMAAWVTGSYAREEADEVSDLDLSLVVADSFAEALCARLAQVSHETAQQRFTLFSRFGKPALVHENNHNAPAGGTFTFVLYAGSGLMVDWILIPQTHARRQFSSRVLFEKENVMVAPAPEAEDLPRAQQIVSEQWAFFWMMAAITVKHIVRGDSVFVATWLDQLQRIVEDIERHLRREPWSYTRGSRSWLQPTRAGQIESLRSLCEQMQTLATQIQPFTGTAPSIPMGEIEFLLALAKEAHASH
jgi:predicted nucleotidyltransferase